MQFRFVKGALWLQVVLVFAILLLVLDLFCTVLLCLADAGKVDHQPAKAYGWCSLMECIYEVARQGHDW